MAKAEYDPGRKAWTDGKGHLFDVLPSYIGAGNPPGWTVIIHRREPDKNVDTLIGFAGQYDTEADAWKAAQEFAQRSAAGERDV